MMQQLAKIRVSFSDITQGLRDAGLLEADEEIVGISPEADDGFRARLTVVIQGPGLPWVHDFDLLPRLNRHDKGVDDVALALATSSV